MTDAPPPRVRERLRDLPSVDRLATSVARAELAARRDELLAGAADEVDLVSRARERLRPSLRRVLNATGVVVHTNLGRAPLSAAARAAVNAVAEVGTTNRTRLADYAAALSERTGAILRAHPSNFRTLGFTEEVEIEQLCGLGVPVIDDVGSGALADDLELLAEEPAVRRSLKAGAAVVCFSGDKLLGGPQAGG